MKFTQIDLRKVLDDAKEKVKPGERYYHYKSPDKYYTIIDIALDEESRKPYVIYQSEYGEKIVWSRSLERFDGEVEDESGKTVKRFSKVQPM